MAEHRGNFYGSSAGEHEANGIWEISYKLPRVDMKISESWCQLFRVWG